MRTKAEFRTLIAELNGDVEELRRLQELNFKAWSQTQLARLGLIDPVGWGEVASTLRVAYEALETYFLRVSRSFENDLPEDRWHGVLVEKMAREVPKLRPALLTDEATKAVLMWMRFCRHGLKFPDEEPNDEKTAAVQRLAWSVLEPFPLTHDVFVAKLRLLVP